MKKKYLIACLLLLSLPQLHCQRPTPCLNSVSKLEQISLSSEQDISLELACKISTHEVISVSIYQNDKFITYVTKEEGDPLSISFHFSGLLSKQEGLIPGDAVLIISRTPAETNQDLLSPIEITSGIKLLP